VPKVLPALPTTKSALLGRKSRRRPRPPHHSGPSSLWTSISLPTATRGLLSLSLTLRCSHGSALPRLRPPPAVQLGNAWRCRPRRLNKVESCQEPATAASGRARRQRGTRRRLEVSNADGRHVYLLSGAAQFDRLYLLQQESCSWLALVCHLPRAVACSRQALHLGSGHHSSPRQLTRECRPPLSLPVLSGPAVRSVALGVSWCVYFGAGTCRSFAALERGPGRRAERRREEDGQDGDASGADALCRATWCYGALAQPGGAFPRARDASRERLTTTEAPVLPDWLLHAPVAQVVPTLVETLAPAMDVLWRHFAGLVRRVG